MLKYIILFIILYCLYIYLFPKSCGCGFNVEGFTPDTYVEWTGRNNPTKVCLNNCQGNRYDEYMPCMYNCLENDTFRKHYYLQ